MLDARMLTLYKQHYLNNYPEAMKCQYSCLGYYDGMDIEPIKSHGTNQREEELTFFDLWRESVIKGKQLSGGYSGQNISIFRFCDSENDKTEEFWMEQERMPFCGVCFVQMKDLMKYKELSKKIERLSYKQDEDSVEYGVLTYYTYDNADMVILLNANSITCLENQISAIEREEEVVYLHSIWGISEEYLQYFKEQHQELGKKIIWKKTTCDLNEKIDSIMLKLVTSYESDVEGRVSCVLQKELCGGAPQIQFSYVIGHENIIVNISNAEVIDLLKLFVSGGFATHQNSLYGNGLYNVETSIRIENREVEGSWSKKANESETKLSSWCGNRIAMLRKVGEPEEDEGLVACFHSLIQTLNMLAQYERFTISKNIFSLLYPSLNMFFEQMEEITIIGKKEERLKTAICKYLDAVNSMVYHTVHTDQVFLMVPGYSGSAFVVPTKICMLYMWYARNIIGILNDSQNKYECLLTPVLEIRPQTSFFDMGLAEENQLICIELSHRSLYRPNYMMIILAHEIAHYVGDEIRKRSVRVQCLIESVAFVLTEGIMPMNSVSRWKDDSLIKENFEYARERVRNLISSEMAQKVDEAGDNYYHATKILPALTSACRQVLVDENNGIREELYSVKQEVHEKMREDFSYKDTMYDIYSYQKECEYNRKEILASGVVEIIISELITAYQEVFSDIAAYAVLGFSNKLFVETFEMSEGVKIDEAEKIPQQRIREGVIKKIIEGETEYVDRESVVYASEETASITNQNNSKRIYEDLFLYDSVQNSLFEYAKACYSEISQHFEREGIKDRIEAIQKMFRSFNEESLNRNIYESVLYRMVEYEKEIVAVAEKNN